LPGSIPDSKLGGSCAQLQWLATHQVFESHQLKGGRP
jgi:hypothetical protein